MRKIYRLLSPKLVGARFENHTIPLEILRDLSVLEEMVVEAAKWRYRQENPGRKRSPRGFTDNINVALSNLLDGSAVPELSLAVEQSELLQPPELRYFEEAFESISNAIDAAENNQPVQQHLPDHLLAYFDRFGRSLRDSESIQMRPDNTAHPARLTQPVRRRLVLASSKVQEVTEEVTLRGTIPEADQAGMTFEIYIIGRSKVSAPLEMQYFDTVIEAFNGYQNNTKVMIQGVARCNRYGRIKKIDSIEHVTILDANDVGVRIQELKTLKDGWLDGDGIAPEVDKLDWLHGYMNFHYPEDYPLPFIFPTPEGGVQFEWTFGSYEVSLEINLETKAATWNKLNTETMDIEEFEASLNGGHSWEEIISRIKSLSGV